MRVRFLTAQGELAGGINLFFTTPPKYKLLSCITNRVDLPTNLPSDTDKVWQVTLTKKTGARHILLLCNSMEVVNLVLSDSTCSSTDWNTWSQDVKKIQFTSQDTASDFYLSHPETFFPGNQTMFCNLNAQVIYIVCSSTSFFLKKKKHMGDKPGTTSTTMSNPLQFSPYIQR